ncbi:vacuole membrane protein 1 isoform X2 [Chrysoperla carnea]|uniref:vacuole membrane protein 1 isoform X2 n=1 Tax=Chrysoperla carnea TaxID=189513 RepID=UPI001D073AA8|nr:vacuole membrane protein 1 isoform X2 [Chrysoperla carnea]
MTTLYFLDEKLQRLGHRMTSNNASNNTSTKRKEVTAANGDKKNILLNNTQMKRNNSQTTVGSGSTSSSRSARSNRVNNERNERENLVLWKSPIRTLQYSFYEFIDLIVNYGKKLLYYRTRVLLIILVVSILTYSLSSEHYLKCLTWSLYWIGLGILSSVGFGTGLHTFILYLGPHIAKVTLAAYECNALNFPSPPYPDEIICPDNPDLSNPPSILSIMAKVRVEAMLWGAGTALGELPPYFMARAARLSGTPSEEEEDLIEFQELQRKQNENPESLTFVEKLKTSVEILVRKVGFFGILAAASIPNPLFDLAGMTCGHFLIPFWTFFGATLIGKAIIKMHIQKLGVIIAFNEVLVEKFIQAIAIIPIIGNKLQEPIRNVFKSQKAKLHNRVDEAASANLVGWLFEKLVFLMILYFVVSIIHSLAQVHHKKLHSKKGNQTDATKKVAVE